MPVNVPQLVVPKVPGRDAPAAVDVLRRPNGRAGRTSRVTGTNGKTTTAYLLSRSSTRPGSGPGCSTNVERRVGGEVRAVGLNTPEAIDLQRLFREMLDAGNRHVRDGGDVAWRPRRAGSTGCASPSLVFTNLTQDHLDFHGTMERLLRVEAPTVRAGRARRRQRRRRVRAAPRGGAARRDHVRLRTRDLGDSPSSSSRGASTSRTRLARRAAAARAARRRRATRSNSGIEAVDAACPAGSSSIDEGQPFTVLVDYAHTPGVARDGPPRRSRAHARPRHLRLRLRRRPRSRRSGR